MVFQEARAFWFWPPSWSSSYVLKDTAECKKLSPAEGAEGLDEEARSFDIADSVEKGFAREIVTEFTHPLRRSSQLWRFYVRAEDRLQYRLFSDEGEFLMYARASLEAQKVMFFLYDPCDQGQGLYDPCRPVFTMGFNREKTEWRIVQERCEYCQYSPKHFRCACYGKPEVAFIRHSRKRVGEGIVNCMDVQVPGDLDAGQEVQELATQEPSWNEELGSLVLDFADRQIRPSEKNFQLALRQEPDQIVCQYGKIGPTTFSLDFAYPFSVIQAFGTSLTTFLWT